MKNHQALSFLYVNYKQEVSIRNVIPSELFFGETDFHPNPQWLLKALDLNRGMERIFAVKDIVFFNPIIDNYDPKNRYEEGAWQAVCASFSYLNKVNPDKIKLSLQDVNEFTDILKSNGYEIRKIK